MPEERRVVITRTEKGTGWVLFAPRPDKSPSPEATPIFLHKTVSKWVEQNSIIEVREMLGLVQNHYSWC